MILALQIRINYNIVYDNTLCDPFSIISDPTNKHEQQLNKEIALEQGTTSFFDTTFNVDILTC